MLEVRQSSARIFTDSRCRSSFRREGRFKQPTATYLAIFPDDENVKRGEDFILLNLRHSSKNPPLIIANEFNPSQFIEGGNTELRNYLPYVGFEIAGLIGAGETNPVATPVLGFLPQQETVKVKLCPTGIKSLSGARAFRGESLTAYSQLLGVTLNRMGYSVRGRDPATLPKLPRSDYHMFQYELNERIYLLFWNAMRIVVPQICETYQKNFKGSSTIVSFKPRLVKRQSSLLVGLKGCYLLSFFDENEARNLASEIARSPNQEQSTIRKKLSALLRNGLQQTIGDGRKYLPIKLVYPRVNGLLKRQTEWKRSI